MTTQRTGWAMGCWRKGAETFKQGTGISYATRHYEAQYHCWDGSSLRQGL